MGGLRGAGSHVANAAASTSTHGIEVSGLELTPETTCRLAVAHRAAKHADSIVEDATAMRVTLGIGAGQYVVLASLNAL